MKTNLKTFAAALGLMALPASAALATAYSMPYTASFQPPTSTSAGMSGQAANVVFFAFDAGGVCRVGPASYVNSAGATVTGPNNEPVVKESFDASGTGGTGAYYTVLPLDTIWGALHIKVVITGQAGIVAEGSLQNRAGDIADGYTFALPLLVSSTNGAATSTGVKILSGQTVLASNLPATAVSVYSPGTVSLSGTDEGQIAKIGTAAGQSPTAPAWYTAPPATVMLASAQNFNNTGQITAPAWLGVSSVFLPGESAKLTTASTAQQSGQAVTLPATVLSAADLAAVQQAIMTYSLHTGVSYQRAVAQIYLDTVGAATPTKSGTVQTNPYTWPDGTVGQTSTLDSSSGKRTEAPGTLPN